MGGHPAAASRLSSLIDKEKQTVIHSISISSTSTASPTVLKVNSSKGRDPSGSGAVEFSLVTGTCAWGSEST